MILEAGHGHHYCRYLTHDLSFYQVSATHLKSATQG